MIRVAAITILALALVSCGRGERTGAPLQGKWGWFVPVACEDNRDAIEFDGRNFRHWALPRAGNEDDAPQVGEVIREGHDTVYTQNEAGWITATYVIDRPDGGTQTVALTFEPGSLRVGDGTEDGAATRDILVFRGSVIDGIAPENAAGFIGQPLYRCGASQS